MLHLGSARDFRQNNAFMFSCVALSASLQLDPNQENEKNEP
jgi:hypothetical protein